VGGARDARRPGGRTGRARRLQVALELVEADVETAVDPQTAAIIGRMFPSLELKEESPPATTDDRLCAAVERAATALETLARCTFRGAILVHHRGA
jgi:hypothetical protein